MSKYFITLKPVEDYFFGGENTFKNNDNEETNYFARSNPYPQQTSLLGLLRHLLLISNNALPLYKNKDLAVELIGGKSFNPENEVEEQNFGLIKDISPLCIFNKKNKKIYRISLAHENFTLIENEGQILLNKVKDSTYTINDYDPKEYYGAILYDADNNSLEFDEVFKEIKPKIGIDKDREQDDENKMFKQIFYTLKSDFYFALYANIKDNYSFNNKENKTNINKSGIIAFGGEQKQFAYELAKEEEPQFIKEPKFSIKHENKIVLLSDAYVNKSIFDNAKIILNEIQDFRTVTIGFYKQKFKKEKVKYNLLKRGTVIFYNAKNEECIIKELEEYKNYRNIGFNQYIKK